MKTNFMAYVSLSSQLMSLLETSSGRIVVMNSVAGKIGQPFLAAYSASKFALNGFFQAFRYELKMRDSKISVTNCNIGLINTDNAINNLKNFGLKRVIETTSPATADGCARHVIQGATNRRENIYYPFTTYYLLHFDYFLPSLSERLLRHVYTV